MITSLILGFISTSLFAQIKGPVVVPTNKLTVLEAPEAPGKPEDTFTIWQPSVQLDSIKRRQEFIFVSPKTNTTLVINAICISIVDGKLDVKEFEHNLIVVSDDPNPTPDPNPNPTPTPDPSLTPFQKVVKAATIVYPPDECKKVAAVYGRVAKAIENGKVAVNPPGTEVITSPNVAFGSFKAYAIQELGQTRWDAWKPAFQKIDAAAQAENPQTVYDIAKTMRQAEQVLAK